MKESLKPGIAFEHRFTLTESKMVPALYPEATELRQMPAVFATGFMIGFLEWACQKAVIPHLDWPREQTLGTHVNVSHSAATPAGCEVIAKVELIAVAGRRLKFHVEGYDEIEQIAAGEHERFVIDLARFEAGLRRKREAL